MACTWLASTAARWLKASSPSRGTLPCTTAMVTCSPVVGSGTAAARPIVLTATSSDTGSASSGARRTSTMLTAARDPPSSATASVTAGAPPRAASGVSRLSPWLKASRPQGKPPNGTRSRAASSSTHSGAVHTPQPGSLPASASPAPRGAKNSACSSANANHAPGPATAPDHDSSGTKSASPPTSPVRAARRNPAPRQASVSAATPTGANQMTSYGGKATVSASPEATARSSRRVRSARPGREGGSVASASWVRAAAVDVTGTFSRTPTGCR